MRIGFDAKRLFCNATGLGNYSRSLVANLQKYFSENSYHLFTTEKRQNNSTLPFLGNKKYHIHESKARIKAYWRSFSMVNDLIKSEIDIYHGLSNELPHNLQQSGIKSVVTIHDLIFKTQPNTYSFSEKIIYDRKFRYACQHADKIIAISENTKKDIIHFYGIEEHKIEVIYQVCNPIFYTARTEAENAITQKEYHLPKKFFLYVGSVEARKNLKLIVKAYQHIPPQNRVPLIIVGKGGAYKKEVKSLIDQLQLNDYFIWLDKLSNNLHLQSIYQMAEALIYPSFYEGFGLPIAEALLSQTPVIAANTSSLVEAGGPNSIYIDPNDADKLAIAMQNILNDEHIKIEMRKKGLEYALGKFSPNLVSSQLMKVYETLLS